MGFWVSNAYQTDTQTNSFDTHLILIWYSWYRREYQMRIRWVSDPIHNFDHYVLLCFTDDLTIFTIVFLFQFAYLYSKILLILMILRWDRCAKMPRGGGHHRKADDKQSLRVEGCQLDCRWFDTPFLRAPCLRSRYLGAPCCACVARADYDGGRSVNSPCLCIWIQWGRTKWVMRCSFRMTR